MQLFIKKLLQDYGVHFSAMALILLILMNLVPYLMGFPSPNRMGTVFLSIVIAIIFEALGLFKFKI